MRDIKNSQAWLSHLCLVSPNLSNIQTSRWQILRLTPIPMGVPPQQSMLAPIPPFLCVLDVAQFLEAVERVFYHASSCLLVVSPVHDVPLPASVPCPQLGNSDSAVDVRLAKYGGASYAPERGVSSGAVLSAASRTASCLANLAAAQALLYLSYCAAAREVPRDYYVSRHAAEVNTLSL